MKYKQFVANHQGGWAALVCVLVYLVFTIAGGLLGYGLGETIWAATLAEVVALLALGLFNWLTLRVSWRLAPHAGRTAALVSLPALGVAVILAATTRWGAVQQTAAVAAGTVLYSLVGAALREGLFRGLLLPSMLRRDRLWYAVLIGGIVEACMTLVMSLTGMSGYAILAQGVAALAFSFVYAALYLKTGSLLWGIGLHAVVDVATTFNAAGGGPQSGTLYGVMLALDLLVAAAAWVVLLRTQKAAALAALGLSED
ncbi:CPBP family intramembrane glutamic endopeptidase [Lacticaseibacillus suihuaensis]